MELTAVRFEIDDGVATVWLHRPHRHNAWTGRMHREYRQVLAHLEATPEVRVVVVTGTGRVFCVGGDSEVGTGTGDGRREGLKGKGGPGGHEKDSKK